MPLGTFNDPEGKFGPKGGVVDNHGTEADGTRSKEYCSFCYKAGNFTAPDITLDEMMRSSVTQMTSDPDSAISVEKAKELVEKTIPNLGRWSGK